MKFKDLDPGDVFLIKGFISDVTLIKVERTPDGYNTLMLPWFDLCETSDDDDVILRDKKVKVVENEN